MPRYNVFIGDGDGQQPLDLPETEREAGHRLDREHKRAIKLLLQLGFTGATDYNVLDDDDDIRYAEVLDKQDKRIGLLSRQVFESLYY